MRSKKGQMAGTEEARQLIACKSRTAINEKHGGTGVVFISFRSTTNRIRKLETDCQNNANGMKN
jgi:hypothetical protein